MPSPRPSPTTCAPAAERSTGTIGSVTATESSTDPVLEFCSIGVLTWVVSMDRTKGRCVAKELGTWHLSPDRPRVGIMFHRSAYVGGQHGPNKKEGVLLKNQVIGICRPLLGKATRILKIISLCMRTGSYPSCQPYCPREHGPKVASQALCPKQPP